MESTFVILISPVTILILPMTIAKRTEVKHSLGENHLIQLIGNITGGETIIMLSELEVASEHCGTVPNKTKYILGTVMIERIFLYMVFGCGIPCRVVQGSQLTVETVGINRKV